MATQQELIDAFKTQSFVYAITNSDAKSSDTLEDGRICVVYRLTVFIKKIDGSLVREMGSYTVVTKYGEAIGIDGIPPILSEEAYWEREPKPSAFDIREKDILEYLKTSNPNHAFAQLLSFNINHGYATVKEYSKVGDKLVPKELGIYSENGKLTGREIDETAAAI